ncbi:uncharacterized protein LACBIDRAFT_309736 [Laccaria bicolor S238N-H82]|uniref:Cytochrome c oxidase subunit 8, mitochondrial n=1 Tax=Laccaria bicolor (strain S238N-H82 / ATCC MYA-4686) TaxID=486041 RepID=B0DSY9_LACBS|nr:uncharacterized protein LACBIDRAFT_309736 [Laccaria bicolor S238N-H82]EDR02402.1 predicted protein [Laccaria bicolor S238N-H82]|eukprot:XP_001887079.1 predicted protein [Laccaria bicolor S238N-H82]
MNVLSLRRSAHSHAEYHVNAFAKIAFMTFNKNYTQHVPFSYSNRTTFRLKALAFFGTAFAIPFVAVWWGWNRKGGLNNP